MKMFTSGLTSGFPAFFKEIKGSEIGLENNNLTVPTNEENGRASYKLKPIEAPSTKGEIVSFFLKGYAAPIALLGFFLFVTVRFITNIKWDLYVAAGTSVVITTLLLTGFILAGIRSTKKRKEDYFLVLVGFLGLTFGVIAGYMQSSVQLTLALFFNMFWVVVFTEGVKNSAEVVFAKKAKHWTFQTSEKSKEFLLITLDTKDNNE